MAEWTIGVYDVNTPEGPRQIVSCVPHEHVFKRGLTPEAVIGQLLRPLEPEEPIHPDVFARNPAFVAFMHEVIARRAPESRELMAEAQRQKEGWVYLIDLRTPTPDGEVPPHDIIGAFQVTEERLVPESYRPNPAHAILSDDGFFDLGTELQKHLLDELMRRRSGEPGHSSSQESS
jgi:hypothetical protein